MTTGPSTRQPARPLLKPALRRVWRDEHTLQLGLDPGHAVVIGGLDPATVAFLECLDGTRDRATALGRAAGLGVAAGRAVELLDLLGLAGVLDDAAADQRGLSGLGSNDRRRLAPERDAASLLRAGPRRGVAGSDRGGGSAGGDGDDGGTAVLARRRASVVRVHGAGRVGAAVTTLLAAAGVGTLVVVDQAITRPEDVGPAGPSMDDLGMLRSEAAFRAARRVTPSLRRVPRPGQRVDLAVVTAATEPGLADRLLRDGLPHLFAEVRETTGVVGPFVLPGRSACRRCLDLHRADRDPAWPSVAAALAGSDPSACDTVLATAVAAQAALQVMAYVDAGAVGPAALPPAVNGTVEIGLADGRVRRRSWSPHPWCGCAWDQAASGG